VRLAVYRGFVEEGRAPSVGDLAAGLGASEDAVVAALGSSTPPVTWCSTSAAGGS
jgi:hypothetical protein